MYRTYLLKNTMQTSIKSLKNLVYVEIDDINEYIDFSENVKHIKLGKQFNSQFLPSKKLKYLYLGNSYNVPLPNLPDSLEHLEIGNYFNQIIVNLPKNLIYLKLGNLYDHTLNHLPDSLKHLEIGDNFDQIIIDFTFNVVS